MPQAAIRDIYHDGKIIPPEDVPHQKNTTVFTDRHDDESRYHRQDWQLSEKEASEDYRTRGIPFKKGEDNHYVAEKCPIGKY